MKKDASIEWGEVCQTTLDSIIAYLITPPILASTVKGKPLVYILALDHSLGALLAHRLLKEGNALYYLS